MRHFFYILCLLLIACTPTEQAGDTYRGWAEGEFDIHHIYTGHGEANYLIFPDGTSMLIDTGDHDPAYEIFPYMTKPMPDNSRRAGEWVARYIERVNPHKNKVNYMMLSHFHSDHMGSMDSNGATTSGRNPDYKLVGLAQVGEWIEFDKAFDRGYPEYNYPKEINDTDVNNYRNFLRYHAKTHGLKQEKFNVGALNQITLMHKPTKYADLFSVRNLASSGEVWSGSNNPNTRYYDLNPDNTKGGINENTCSMAIRIDYGLFSYYTGGDLTRSINDSVGNKLNIEAIVGEICGEVDVCKSNHHAYKDSMVEGFLDGVKAKHYVNCTWDLQHTQPEIFKRMLSKSDCTIFHQYLWPEVMQKHANEEWTKSVIEQGHIVIKAYDKGRKYKVYILSAEDETMTIKAIYGPFEA